MGKLTAIWDNLTERFKIGEAGLEPKVNSRQFKAKSLRFGALSGAISARHEEPLGSALSDTNYTITAYDNVIENVDSE